MLLCVAALFVNMPGSLHRDTLLGIGKLLQENDSLPRLSADCLKNIRQCGINRIPATKRGTRAGRNLRSYIPVCVSHRSSESHCGGQVGQNSANLIELCGPKPDSSKTHLNACLINCQSVCNKAQVIKDYVVDNNLDIAVLTETWLCPSKDNVCGDLTPSGFDFQHIPRKGKRGGGVGLLFKCTLKVSHIENETSSSFEAFSVCVTSESTSVRIIVIYRLIPTRSNGLSPMDFHSDFQDLIDKYILQPTPLLIAGDFNIHWDVENDREASSLRDFLHTTSLVQHVKNATHQDGHTIDLVISRKDDGLVDSVTVKSLISDHHAVHFDLIMDKPPPPREKVSFRKFSSVDPTKFRSDLAKCDLVTHTSQELDSLVHQYNTQLSSLIDMHAPLKTRSLLIKARAPWYNAEVAEAKRLRRKLERQWRRTKLVVHQEMYKAQKVRVNSLIHEVRAAYYNGKITECAGNQKSLYKIVDKLLHRKNTNTLPDHQCPSELATRMSDFFMSKVANIRSGLVGSQGQLDQSFEETEASVIMSVFTPATEEEVTKLVKTSSNATCIYDPIPTSFVKKHCDLLVPVITDIVNRSLSTGVFPDFYKQAIVKPLLKKPGLDKNNLKNYRPVSNLSFTSKIVEKVVAARLCEHMKQNHLDEVMQSAYKQHHSVETALLRVQSDILSAMDNNKGVILALLDLSAAFDTVDHAQLLARLQKRIGLQGTVLEWFSSYLKDRKQTVSIGANSSSDPSVLHYGVPQGSVLGPILFIVYTLPIGDIARRYTIFIHIYADDTQLYITFDIRGDPSTAIQRLEECIAWIKAWMERNHLKINDDKTEIIILTPSTATNKVQIPSVQVGNSTIAPVPVVRNLGSMFDEHMTMNEHVKRVCSGSYLHLRNIAAIRHSLTDEAAAQLIHAFVTSRLDSCNSLLYGLPDCAIAKLQRVQNMAAKLILKRRKYDRVTPLLQSLHWLPVRQRIHYKIILLTFKCLHGMAPQYLSELLALYKPARSLRSENTSMLVVPRTRVKLGERSFAAAAPKLWNELPLHIRKIDNLCAFKSSLKTYLFRIAYP